jgi:hypothetical protein
VRCPHSGAARQFTGTSSEALRVERALGCTAIRLVCSAPESGNLARMTGAESELSSEIERLRSRARRVPVGAP